MALGAVILALVGGIYASTVEPGTQVDGTMIDTSPVIGLTIVIGFVLGAALGALVAVILDFAVGRKSLTAEVEHTSITVHYDDPAADEVFDEQERDVADSATSTSPPGPETKS